MKKNNSLQKMVVTMFVVTILTCSFITAQEKNNNIELIVKGIEDIKGTLLIALYDSEEGYKAGKSFKTFQIKVSKNSETLLMENIPSGIYAVKMFHDENDNKKMDTGLFGIPTEPYGFSNDAKGFMGPAKFGDAKFKHESTTTKLTINL